MQKYGKMAVDHQLHALINVTFEKKTGTRVGVALECQHNMEKLSSLRLFT